MKKIRKVLVVNSGSSSLKYQLFDMKSETRLAKGLVERMKGTITAQVKDELFIIEILLPLSEKAVSEKERNVAKDH